MKDFKYKNYFSEEFNKKSIERYLRYVYQSMSFRNFDFAGEDKYDTYESGGGCYLCKGYHTSSFLKKKKKMGNYYILKMKLLKINMLLKYINYIGIYI